MRRTGGWVSRSVVLFACGSVVLALGVILVWCFAQRWAWPSLLPQRLSLRGIREVVEGRAWMLLYSSILISGTAALIAVCVGLLTARALVFFRFPGRGLVLLCSILPLIVPTAAFGMGVHPLLLRAGLSDTAAGVILVHVICALPYTVTILTDSSHAIGGRMEEQARVLGAGRLRAFFCTTLPALMPALFSAFVMAYITSFSEYFLTLLIGGGSVRSFTVVVVPYLQNGDRTLACAYTVLFLTVTLVVFWLVRTLVKPWYPDPKHRPSAQGKEGSVWSQS